MVARPLVGPSVVEGSLHRRLLAAAPTGLQTLCGPVGLQTLCGPTVKPMQTTVGGVSVGVANGQARLMCISSEHPCLYKGTGDYGLYKLEGGNYQSILLNHLVCEYDFKHHGKLFKLGLCPI